VVFVDQSPIGKTARSNPASYVGAFDEIRKLFAPRRWRCSAATRPAPSASTGDGRCPTCGGSGFEHVEMQFLSDVYLRCPDCDGTRYRAEALEVKIERARPAPRALSVADVLELTVSEATALFESDPAVCCACWRRSRRRPGIREAGPAGADAVGRRGAAPEAGRLPGRGGAGQPVKNRKAVVLPKRLFMFDEPTTGLHFDDIAKLMRAFGKLLDGGHSLIVIEHNLDVIRASTGSIDLGPEGDAGGEVVCVGTPDDVRRAPNRIPAARCAL
jgi:excinuclease ABC subunit A